MSEIIKEFKKGDLLYIDRDGKAQWGQPEGYPYKGKNETVAMEEQELTFVRTSGAAADMVISLVSFTSEPTVGNKVKVVWDGNEYICEVSDDNSAVAFGNFELIHGNGGFDEPFAFINDDGWMCGCKGKNGDTHTVSVSIFTEATHPMAMVFLPQATSTTHGIVKQMSYIPNATGDAPTAENFNQLLRELKNAGLMK